VTIDTTNITVDAINILIKAYKDLEEAAREKRRVSLEQEIATTQTVVKETKIRINAMQQEYLAKRATITGKIARAEEEQETTPYRSIFTHMAIRDSLTYYRKQLSKESETYTESLRVEVQALNKSINALNDAEAELEKLLKESSETGIGDKYLGGNKAADTAKKLTDIIGKYIETAMRAAEVQGMLNSETQRTIDGYKAKIDYHSRDTATAQERAIALQTEAEMMGKLKEKQEGVHKEANYLREALAKLEQRQSTVNVTTDEGWDAYKRLESQIESIKDSVEKLGVEWVQPCKSPRSRYFRF